MNTKPYKGVIEVEVIVPMYTPKGEKIPFGTADEYVERIAHVENSGAFFGTTHGQRDASGDSSLSGEDAVKKATEWRNEVQMELSAKFPKSVYGRDCGKALVHVRVENQSTDDDGCSLYGALTDDGFAFEFDYTEIDIGPDDKPFLREVDFESYILLPIGDVDIDPDHFYVHPKIETKELPCG